MKLAINKSLYKSFFVALLTGFLAGCSEPDEDVQKGSFESMPVSAALNPRMVAEASGIADSRTLKGNLWVHEDSGAPAEVHLLSHDGKNIRAYSVPDAANHDWEDIAYGPGPDGNAQYLYIADIGNNSPPAVNEHVIYRVREIQSTAQNFTASDVEKIRFRYPDGPYDAEALLLDPATKDLYIVTKEPARAQLFRLPYPQAVNGTITAENMGTIPSVTLATAGDISPNGDEILIRTYLGVYYWKKKMTESIAQALTRTKPGTLSVALEQQGEAICFDNAASGFFTLSERRADGPPVSLNYYRRK